jgi:hypothetical protein
MKSNKWAFVMLSALSTVGLGCATERYGFRPATVASSEGGLPASHYVVPPEAPRGEVYVTSFGTRDVGDGGEAAGSQLIHVRLAVANQSSDAPFTVDPGHLLLVAPGAAPQRPDFLEVDGRQSANTEIGRGQRRMFDVYYRMPGGAADARRVPSFDFDWQVNAGGKLVADRTPFVREPYRDYEEAGRTTLAVGVAAPWWWGWYGPPWWGWYGPYGPYAYGGYGYGPRVGVGVHGYYGGSRYRSAGPGYGGYGGGGHARMAPAVRGRGR